jgi:hypothetical protein
MPKKKSAPIEIQIVVDQKKSKLRFQHPDGAPADEVEAVEGQKITWSLVTEPGVGRTSFSVIFSPLATPARGDGWIESTRFGRASLIVKNLRRSQKEKDPSFKYAVAVVVDSPAGKPVCNRDYEAPTRQVEVLSADPIIIIRRSIS